MKIIQVFANHEITSFQNLNPLQKISDLIRKGESLIFPPPLVLEANIFNPPPLKGEGVRAMER